MPEEWQIDGSAVREKVLGDKGQQMLGGLEEKDTGMEQEGNNSQAAVAFSHWKRSWSRSLLHIFHHIVGLAGTANLSSQIAVPIIIPQAKENMLSFKA